MLLCQLWILKVKNNENTAGIYIHFPFCVRKCSYCDFYSVSVTELTILERYTRCLLEEIENKSPLWKDRIFSTIYLGGGTPSMFSPAQIARILTAVFKHYSITAEPEISMEANPATLTPTSLAALKQTGINRISLGVQSFQETELKLLGRIHGVREVWETIDSLEKAGLSNYNIDLIYGIPGQSLQTWIDNLGMAVKCHPQHISAYLLQLDPQTPLAVKIKQGSLPESDEDLEARMYYQCLDYLASEGYEHYEISNFSRPHFACRHNLIYWQACEYLGFGAGAVSYQQNIRSMNQPDLQQYLLHLETGLEPPAQLLETMSKQDQFVDAVILGLRMVEGINPEELLQRFGIDFLQVYHAILENLQEQALIKITAERVALSPRGYFLSNQVLCRFL